MVAIAKALMVEPVVLLLDEPTAGLSPRFRGDIFRVVREINARGVPVLMVEQNARQALGIADRGYVLVDGRNRLDGTGPALLADPAVGAMFLGGRGGEGEGGASGSGVAGGGGGGAASGGGLAAGGGGDGAGARAGAGAAGPATGAPPHGGPAP